MKNKKNTIADYKFIDIIGVCKCGHKAIHHKTPENQCDYPMPSIGGDCLCQGWQLEHLIPEIPEVGTGAEEGGE